MYSGYGCGKGCDDWCCPSPEKPCPERINCPCCVRAMAELLRQLAGSTSTFTFNLVSNDNLTGVTILSVLYDTIVKVQKNKQNIDYINICEISTIEDAQLGGDTQNNANIEGLTLTKYVGQLEDCSCCETALKYIFEELQRTGGEFKLKALGNINYSNVTVKETTDVVDGVVKIYRRNEKATLVSLCQVTELQDQATGEGSAGEAPHYRFTSLNSCSSI